MLVTVIALLTPAFAEEIQPRDSLHVTGVGEVYVVPDEAVLTLGVRAQSGTAADAFKIASDKMNAVNTALKGKVMPERIRTSQLSLQPRYEYNESSGPRLVGYEASSILEIRVDEPDDAGMVLDAAVEAGANEVLGVAWKVEDEEAAQQEALEAAVEDARANASLVANDLGVPLGSPTNVTIRTQETTPPSPIYMERAAADADMAEMPVLAGEQTYRAAVDVTFAIGEEGTPTGAPEETPPAEVEPEPQS